MGEPYESPEVKAYLKRFKEMVLPNLADAAAVVSIVSPASPDAKMCLEIGAAVLLDKPIIVAVFRGATIPQHLKKVATEIVEIEKDEHLSSPAIRKKFQAAIDRVMGKGRH